MGACGCTNIALEKRKFVPGPLLAYDDGYVSTVVELKEWEDKTYALHGSFYGSNWKKQNRTRFDELLSMADPKSPP